MFRHGGTFTLKENLYTESVEFADDSTKALIGNKFKFKIELKDGLLFNHGQGNPWTEAWRPVKSHKDHDRRAGHLSIIENGPWRVFTSS